MFDNYPKKRKELPLEYQKIYNQHYKSNRDGDTAASGLAQKMEQWLHKKVAEDVGSGKHSKKTLEIGAGTLNQLKYEDPLDFDIIEPFEELFRNSQELPKVKQIFKDIDDVPKTLSYDRIISIATFEHITDLPKVIAKSCLLLKPDGTLRTSIPNEGTFLWKMGWKFTTGIEFKLKYNLDYGTLMNYEHVNTAKEIEDVLKYFYSENKCKTLGLGKGFAFYRFYESSKPNIAKAKAYLESLL